MKIGDYPPQEPTPAFAAEYAAEVKRRSDVPHEDIAYGDDIYQRVAVFAPEEPGGTVLAAIHGGGWTSGYKEWMAFQAPVFTAAGVLFVSIGYRLAPTHRFPAGYDDVRRAIAWIHDNAAVYGGDPGRLFVTGHSAGGHYAALMAVKRDWQAALGLPPDVIRGWLPVSGVFDLTEGSGLSTRPRFLGPEGSGSEVAASPIRQIDGVPPPALLAHGEDDFPHLSTQAEAMEAALRRSGTDVERIVLAGRTHLTAHLAAGEEDGPWVKPALDWMARH